MDLDYKKLFGFGILIWIVIAGTVLVANDIFAGGLRGGSFLIDPLSTGLAAFIITYFCGRNLKLKIASRLKLLQYSISWAIINHALESLTNAMTMTGYESSFQSNNIITNFIGNFFETLYPEYISTWIVLIIIIITPLLTVKKIQPMAVM